MVYRPGAQSPLALDRRVRVEPIKVSEYKYDCGELFSGADRDGRRDYHSLLNSTKGPDRQDRAKLISNANLVKVPDQPDGAYTTLLIGTGIGSSDPQFSVDIVAKDTSLRLESGLKKLGVKRDDIDYVLLPDLGFLTASNLIHQDNRGDREPVCKNAEYILHRDEYDIAMASPKSAEHVYQGVKKDLQVLEGKLQASGKELTIFSGTEHRIGESVRMVRHGGVTPGYCSVFVRVHSETVVISSLLFPTISHLEPGIQFGMSFSRHETFEAKEALLDECWKNQYIILFPHDPGLTAGYVQPHAGGWALEKVGDILH